MGTTHPGTAAKRDPSASGILPSQAIRALVASGEVVPGRTSGRRPVAAGEPQPQAFRAVAHQVRASFLLGAGKRPASSISSLDLQLHAIDLSKGAVPETGCVYVVPLLESLALAGDVFAAANPKSSTGRLDVFTRVITDDVLLRVRPHPARLSRPPLRGDLPADLSDRGAQGLAPARQIRFRRGVAGDSDAERGTAARERLVSAEHAGHRAGHRAVGRSRGRRGRPRRLSGQAAHGGRRRRRAGRVRGARLLGADQARASAGSSSIRTSSIFSPRRRRCTCR